MREEKRQGGLNDGRLHERGQDTVSGRCTGRHCEGDGEGFPQPSVLQEHQRHRERTARDAGPYDSDRSDEYAGGANTNQAHREAIHDGPRARYAGQRDAALRGQEQTIHHQRTARLHPKRESDTGAQGQDRTGLHDINCLADSGY